MAILDLLYELAPWELINTFFIPFVVIFVMLWGILTAMGIFKNKKINIVISLAMVLFLASTDIFPMVSQWMIQLGSMTAVAAFLLLFVGGVILWTINRGRDIYFETGSKGRRLKRLMERRDKEFEKLRTEGNKNKKRALYKNIERLRREIELVESE